LPGLTKLKKKGRVVDVRAGVLIVGVGSCQSTRGRAGGKAVHDILEKGHELVGSRD